MHNLQWLFCLATTTKLSNSQLIRWLKQNRLQWPVGSTHPDTLWKPLNISSVNTVKPDFYQASLISHNSFNDVVCFQELSFKNMCSLVYFYLSLSFSVVNLLWPVSSVSLIFASGECSLAWGKSDNVELSWQAGPKMCTCVRMYVAVYTGKPLLI